MKTAFAFILLSLLASIAEGAFVYDGSGERDPFVPLVGPGGKVVIPRAGTGRSDITPDNAAGAIEIQGILYDPSGNSIAIVNGREVKEGDELVLDTAASPEGAMAAVRIGRIEERGIYIIASTGEIFIKFQEEGNEDFQE